MRISLNKLDLRSIRTDLYYLFEQISLATLNCNGKLGCRDGIAETCSAGQTIGKNTRSFSPEWGK
jgi:hypothetical protein